MNYKNTPSTFKPRKSHQAKIADYLDNKHQTNQKLKQKKINTSFLDNF